MPNSKSKTSTANTVTTNDGLYSYRVTDKVVKRVRKTNGYFAPKGEIYLTLYNLFVNGHSTTTTVVYYGANGRNTFEAEKLGTTGGFSIACQEFDRATTKKFARLVGFTTSQLNRIWPAVARAAAAGR